MGDQKKLYKVQVEPLIVEVPGDVSKKDVNEYLKAVLKYSGDDLVIKNYQEIKIANNGANHGA